MWRRQALAAWLTAPNNLAFWDEDTSTAFAAPGFPAASNLQVSGTHAAGAAGRGFAGIMTAQDRARVRNILMRRYVSPEPSLALAPESQPANLVLQKSVLTVYDPVNNSSNPKAIPGSWVDYTLSATNSGSGSVDVDSLLIVEPVPANAALFVADLAGAGSGPVEFIDGSGAASSGLSLQYGGPGDAGDDIEFSTDGVDYSYTPVPDIDGFDAVPSFCAFARAGHSPAPPAAHRRSSASGCASASSSARRSAQAGFQPGESASCSDNTRKTMASPNSLTSSGPVNRTQAP